MICGKLNRQYRAKRRKKSRSLRSSKKLVEFFVDAVTSLLMLLFLPPGACQGSSRRGKAATCTVGSDWRRKGLPWISVAEGGIGFGLCQVARGTASVSLFTDDFCT
jgi:hypothetical protein